MEKYFSLIERAYDLSLFSNLIPCMVAISKWKSCNFPLKIVAIQSFRTLLFVLISRYYGSIDDSHRGLYYLSPCLDIILVSLLAVTIFDFKKELRWYFALICIIFIALVTNNYFTTTSPISNYFSTGETIFVVIISILILRKVTLTYKSSTYKRSLIWIISALLIMNLFSILISTLMEKMSAYSTDFMQLCWYLSSPLFIVITNLMSTYGFYIIRNKVREA
jgi:hypothetical protein